MKGLLTDHKGDIVLSNGQLQLVNDKELLRQTCESVIGTNKGEWFLNTDEGINFKAILTKSPNMDEVQSEIQAGLLQVDSSLFIQEFTHTTEQRKLDINFTASNGSVIVEGGQAYVR